MEYGLGYTLACRTTSFITRTLWPYRRTELNYMLNLLSDVKGTKILDYGCNTGYFTNMISKRYPDCEVHGADINVHALKSARRKFPHLQFHDVNDAFFEFQPFDAIIISHVLEHIRDRETFLSNVSKLIAHNGRLIIAIPQERIRGDATIFLTLFNAFRLRFENPHVAKLNYADLVKLLARTGFKIDDHVYTNYLFPFKSDSFRLDAWSLVVSSSRA